MSRAASSLALNRMTSDGDGGGGNDDSGLVYGLEFHCRALSAVAADTEATVFMVGTQSLKKSQDNQVGWN